MTFWSKFGTLNKKINLKLGLFFVVGHTQCNYAPQNNIKGIYIQRILLFDDFLKDKVCEG